MVFETSSFYKNWNLVSVSRFCDVGTWLLERALDFQGSRLTQGIAQPFGSINVRPLPTLCSATRLNQRTRLAKLPTGSATKPARAQAHKNRHAALPPPQSLWHRPNMTQLIHAKRACLGVKGTTRKAHVLKFHWGRTQIGNEAHGAKTNTWGANSYCSRACQPVVAKGSIVEGMCSFCSDSAFYLRSRLRQAASKGHFWILRRQTTQLGMGQN